ncbi:hypothetical protein KC845_01225 [Candidatus Kaiserbacteria bacterium]|nr:hypothetical protein [Candidatus Kaiserbacteria bacterium]
MHRKLIISAIVISYLVLVTYGLLALNAQIIVTSIFLFGIPALWLAYFSSAPKPVLISVSLLGVALAVFLEGLAHIYGLWYTMGVDESRLFGLAPVEAIFATGLEVVFLVLLYEALFDDGEYTTKPARERMGIFFVMFLGAIGIVAIHQYVIKDLFINSSYLWIISALLATCFMMLSLYRTFTIRFLDRFVYFTAFASIPLLLNLIVSVLNVQKVYAHFAYAAKFNFFGEMVPLEEILLIFTVPILVATIYEIYLDDVA